MRSLLVFLSQRRVKRLALDNLLRIQKKTWSMGSDNSLMIKKNNGYRKIYPFCNIITSTTAL